MAQAVTWSEQALTDVEAIASYIARDSAYYASRVIEQLFELGDSIGEHPLMGRIVPEWSDANVRERFLYSYRVIYELRDVGIVVLTVIHGRRLLLGPGDRAN